MHMLSIPKPQYSVQHWSKFQCLLMSRISPEINSLILRQSQFLWENPWEAALTMARALRWLRATMACGRQSLSSAVLWEWLEMWSTMANHVATPVVDLFCEDSTALTLGWGNVRTSRLASAGQWCEESLQRCAAGSQKAVLYANVLSATAVARGHHLSVWWSVVLRNVRG